MAGVTNPIGFFSLFTVLSQNTPKKSIHFYILTVILKSSFRFLFDLNQKGKQKNMLFDCVVTPLKQRLTDSGLFCLQFQVANPSFHLSIYHILSTLLGFSSLLFSSLSLSWKKR